MGGAAEPGPALGADLGAFDAAVALDLRGAGADQDHVGEVAGQGEDLLVGRAGQAVGPTLHAGRSVRAAHEVDLDPRRGKGLRVVVEPFQLGVVNLARGFGEQSAHGGQDRRRCSSTRAHTDTGRRALSCPCCARPPTDGTVARTDCARR